MSDQEFYTQVARLVGKDLDTDPEEMLPVKQSIDREFIKLKLTGVIGYMLDNQFEKLCNTMYRLDVSEEKFHNVLSGNNKDDVVNELAELVIEREIQKVKTRELYKNRKL